MIKNLFGTNKHISPLFDGLVFCKDTADRSICLVESFIRETVKKQRTPGGCQFTETLKMLLFTIPLRTCTCIFFDVYSIAIQDKDTIAYQS